MKVEKEGKNKERSREGKERGAVTYKKQPLSQIWLYVERVLVETKARL